MPRLFVIIALLAAALLAAGCTRSHPAASTYSRCRIASVFRDSSMVWLMNDPQLGGPIETYVKKVPLGAEASSESQITIIVQSGGSSSREVLAMEQKQLFSTLLSSQAAFRVEYKAAYFAIRLSPDSGSDSESDGNGLGFGLGL